MRLLLVEDSQRLQKSMSLGLRKSGYAVDLAGDGKEALRRALGVQYDVIILDIMLPGIDGLSVLRELRDKGVDSNILLLTAKDTVTDRVNGLRAGADDYLIKPFAFDELLARIEVLVRRARGRKSAVIRIGKLEIDPASRTVHRAGESISLLPREYALLEYLATRAGEVVSRNDIETHIYDERVEPMSNVIDSAICSLRRKIDAPGGPSCIVTRRRMGYMMVADKPPAAPEAEAGAVESARH